MHYVPPVGKQDASVMAKPSIPNTFILLLEDSSLIRVPMATSYLDPSPISNYLNTDSIIPFFVNILCHFRYSFVISFIPLSYPLFLCHFLYSFPFPLFLCHFLYSFITHFIPLSLPFFLYHFLYSFAISFIPLSFPLFLYHSLYSIIITFSPLSFPLFLYHSLYSIISSFIPLSYPLFPLLRPLFLCHFLYFYPYDSSSYSKS